MPAEALGIDIGNVLRSRWTRLRLPSPGAFDVVRRLDERFGSRIYIVSHANSTVDERRNREWLERHQVFTRTSIAPDHVLFCSNRMKKGEICHTLGITHFVDDRLDVLSAMPHLPREAKLAFQPSLRQLLRHRHVVGEVTIVNGWRQVGNLLLR